MIYIYGDINCESVNQVMNYCRTNKLAYMFYNIIINEKYKQELETKLGHNVYSIPVIFIDDKQIGSIDEFIQIQELNNKEK